MQNQTFKLSLKPNDYPPNVPFVYADQYDVGRVFAATVYDADGSLYNFNGETVTVVGTKPSGTGFSYEATASGNTVTFETTGQMTVVAGNVTCGIIIEKDGDRIGTLHFVLHIQPAALSADTIIDSDDFGSIISDAVAEYLEEHGIVIDDTLSVAGAAADAAAVGEELDNLKSAFDLDSLTPGVKSALLNLLEHVAYIDEDGQDYYDALYDALYNRYWQVTNNLTNCTTSNASEQTLKSGAYSATITASTGYVMTGATVSITMGGTDITATAYSNGVISIPAVTGALVITISAAAKSVSLLDAVFTQGDNLVFSVDTLDSLTQYLVVTATYDDSSTAVISEENYTLSGTLTAGTSTITVSYATKTTTFTVMVTAATDVTPDLSTFVSADSSKNTATYDSTSDTLRVYTLSGKTGTYMQVRVAFTFRTGYKYRVVFDGIITSGTGNVGVQPKTSSSIVKSAGAFTTSGHYTFDFVPSDYTTLTNNEARFGFFCTWGTASSGDVSYKNFRLIEYQEG